MKLERIFDFDYLCFSVVSNSLVSTVFSPCQKLKTPSAPVNQNPFFDTKSNITRPSSRLVSPTRRLGRWWSSPDSIFRWLLCHLFPELPLGTWAVKYKRTSSLNLFRLIEPQSCLRWVLAWLIFEFLSVFSNQLCLNFLPRWLLNRHW